MKITVTETTTYEVEADNPVEAVNSLYDKDRYHKPVKREVSAQVPTEAPPTWSYITPWFRRDTNNTHGEWPTYMGDPLPGFGVNENLSQATQSGPIVLRGRNTNNGESTQQERFGVK